MMRARCAVGLQSVLPETDLTGFISEKLSVQNGYLNE
jgi:hypothetical protein